MPSRNLLVARLAAALLAQLERFAHGGLDAVRADWEAMHAHAGRRLRVRVRDGRRIRQVTGVAQGLTADGGLQLRTRAGLRDLDGACVVSARAA
jgi:biotin-(acetyl-CoA carboxylase) ligase